MGVKRVAAAAALGAACVGAQAVPDFCDAEYECEYRTSDWTRNFYDLKPLCNGGASYTTPPSATGWTITFQICGQANAVCVPQYEVTYNRGAAVQFLDNNAPAGNCTDASGNSQPCTPNCEVIGVGVPIISQLDPSNPAGGVNLSYYSVPENGKDSFKCPDDPITKGPRDRKLTIMLACDATATTPVVGVPYEDPNVPCSYLIPMRSSVACGCAPLCTGNCGLSNCGTYCGPPGLQGGCPTGSCISDQWGVNYCCSPDCRGRQCGGDGCGGQCGACDGGYECSRNQQCVAINPSPAAVPAVQTTTVYTTTAGDKGAAFIGGVLAAGFGTLGLAYFRRIRAAMYAPLAAPLTASGSSGGTV